MGKSDVKITHAKVLKIKSVYWPISLGTFIQSNREKSKSSNENNKCYDRSIGVQLLALSGKYDGPTNRLTLNQTDLPNNNNRRTYVDEPVLMYFC